MLAYCDYIADRIVKYLRNDSYMDGTLLSFVDRFKYDLGPEGEFVSTTKTIEVQDVNCKRYKITVEEL